MNYLTLNLEEVQKIGLIEAAVLNFLKLKKNDLNIKGQNFFEVKQKDIIKNLKITRHALDRTIKNLIDLKFIKKTVHKTKVITNVRFCIEKKVSHREYPIKSGVESNVNSASLKNKGALSADKSRCRIQRQHRINYDVESNVNTAQTRSGVYMYVSNKLLTLKHQKFSDENSVGLKNFESVRKNIMQYINKCTVKNEGSTSKQLPSLKALKGGEMKLKPQMNTKANVDVLEGQKNVIAAEEILKHFNKICEKKYKETAKRNQKNIIDRLNEGFTIEDFKKVIEHKNRTWTKNTLFKGGTKARTYLRPETLFCEKHFENYLNEYEPAPKGLDKETLAFIEKYVLIQK